MRASGRQWSAALVKFVQFVQFVFKKKRATEIRLLPCNAGRGAKQGYRYQFSELGYSQTLQL